VAEARTDKNGLERRRSRYLEAARQFRSLAEAASSSEGQQQLMQLALLYHELAEYAGTARFRATLSDDAVCGPAARAPG